MFYVMLVQLDFSIVLRRIRPLMAYEDLNLLVENQGGIARPREEIALACLYEGRIFDNDSLHKLIMEMEAKQNEAAEGMINTVLVVIIQELRNIWGFRIGPK